MSYKKRETQKYYAELQKQKKLGNKQLHNSTKSEEEEKEFGISKRNIYGIRDLTPYNAIRDMQGEGIVYK